MKTLYIPFEEVKPDLWAGGSTSQYFLHPVHSSYALKNFLFRISSATIEQSPSVFTHFEGYTRYLLMLDGDLDISINGKKQHFKRHEILLFNSADTVVSNSIGTDFNWMVHHSVTEHQLKITEQSENSTRLFLILFALETTVLTVDQETYTLKKTSCFVIENTDRNMVKLSFSAPILFMTLDI